MIETTIQKNIHIIGTKTQWITKPIIYAINDFTPMHTPYLKKKKKMKQKKKIVNHAR